MNLQERLQQLAQQREQLWIASLHETNGAMKFIFWNSRSLRLKLNPNQASHQIQRHLMVQVATS